MESSMEIPQKAKDRTAICSGYIAPGDISKGIQARIQWRHLHMMLIAALFTIAKLWKQPKCCITDKWVKKYGIYTHWSFTEP
jgi:hypothetical protein